MKTIALFILLAFAGTVFASTDTTLTPGYRDDGKLCVAVPIKDSYAVTYGRGSTEVSDSSTLVVFKTTELPVVSNKPPTIKDVDAHQPPTQKSPQKREKKVEEKSVADPAPVNNGDDIPIWLWALITGIVIFIHGLLVRGGLLYIGDRIPQNPGGHQHGGGH